MVLRLIVKSAGGCGRYRYGGRVAGRGCGVAFGCFGCRGFWACFVGFFGGVLSNKKRRRADGVKIGQTKIKAYNFNKNITFV